VLDGVQLSNSPTFLEYMRIILDQTKSFHVNLHKVVSRLSTSRLTLCPLNFPCEPSQSRFTPFYLSPYPLSSQPVIPCMPIPSHFNVYAPHTRIIWIVDDSPPLQLSQLPNSPSTQQPVSYSTMSSLGNSHTFIFVYLLFSINLLFSKNAWWPRG